MKRIMFVFLVLLAASARLEAHAFLKDAEPGVGSTIQTSPNEVRIRFTENIEPAVSSVQVLDASGKEVDKRDLHLDRSDHALLHVSLPRLGAGIYKVVWRVVSADTHVTSGGFTFRIIRDKENASDTPNPHRTHHHD
jgi:methionine-rich copper-binding protein CopC